MQIRSLILAALALLDRMKSLLRTRCLLDVLVSRYPSAIAFIWEDQVASELSFKSLAYAPPAVPETSDPLADAEAMAELVPRRPFISTAMSATPTADELDRSPFRAFAAPVSAGYAPDGHMLLPSCCAPLPQSAVAACLVEPPTLAECVFEMYACYGALYPTRGLGIAPNRRRHLITHAHAPFPAPPSIPSASPPAPAAAAAAATPTTTPTTATTAPAATAAAAGRTPSCERYSPARLVAVRDPSVEAWVRSAPSARSDPSAQHRSVPADSSAQPSDPNAQPSDPSAQHISPLLTQALPALNKRHPDAVDRARRFTAKPEPHAGTDRDHG